jgi:hypothetical protein
MVKKKTWKLIMHIALIAIIILIIVVMVRKVRTLRRRQTRRVKEKFQSGGGANGNIYVFYHVFCNENTMPIMKDQVMKMLFSGLYKSVNSIYVFLTGNENIINQARTFIEKCGKKFIIETPGINDTTYERYTLTKIKSKIKADDKFLYIHDKGTTKANNENVFWWRTWMEYYLMVKHKECIDSLNNYDVIGNFINPYNGTHFAGNFWWCRGDYYLRMPDEIGPGYYDPETYILKGKNVRYLELAKGDAKPLENFYEFGVIPKIYVDK